MLFFIPILLIIIPISFTYVFILSYPYINNLKYYLTHKFNNSHSVLSTFFHFTINYELNPFKHL